jgi:hypothetical protein
VGNIRDELARINSLKAKIPKVIDKKTALRQLHKSCQKQLTNAGSVVVNSEDDVRLFCAFGKFMQEKEEITKQVLPSCKAAQQKLIKHVLGKWTIVAYWHFYSDVERSNFYPFCLPLVRKWCKQEANQLLLKKEVGNFSLSLLVASAVHRGLSSFDRYAQMLTEQLHLEIERILMPLDPNAPTLKEIATEVLQWLQDYEAWLINGYPPGQPDNHTAFGQLLWDAIPLAERDKKLTYLKFWFNAQRTYYRHLKAGNGVVNAQASGDKLLKSYRSQLIALPY